MVELGSVVHKMGSIEASVDNSAVRVIAGVDLMLERRVVDAGGLTADSILKKVQQAMNDFMAPMFAYLEAHARSPVEAAPASAAPAVERSHWHLWEGKMHRVPQDFAFPAVSALTAWQLWCCGNAENHWPPFRSLEPSDMGTRNLRKRLSDLRFLMRKIEQLVKAVDASMWVDTPSIQKTIDMFALAEPGLELANVSEQKRKRRCGQLCWITVVDEIRSRTCIHRPRKRVQLDGDVHREIGVVT
jgi:hypothetical protein